MKCVQGHCSHVYVACDTSLQSPVPHVPQNSLVGPPVRLNLFGSPAENVTAVHLGGALQLSTSL